MASNGAEPRGVGAASAVQETSPFENPWRAVLGGPPDLVLSASRSALVVVDMQYFDAHREWGEGRTAGDLGVLPMFEPYFVQIDRIQPIIRDLEDAFRSKNMEIVHLRVSEITVDSRDIGRKQLVRGLSVPRVSREADFLEMVAPEGDEIVVSKSSSGPFPVTNIDRLLRNVGISDLIFVGTSTGGCVESAVRDAIDLGYDTSVVSDACADTTDANNADSLERLKGIGTRVVTSAVVQRSLSSLTERSPAETSGVERAKGFIPRQLTESSVDADHPYRSIFGPPIRPPLAPAATALLLIDFQRLTADRSSGIGGLLLKDSAAVDSYYERVQTAARRASVLVETARRAGIQVVPVRIAGAREDGRDLSLAYQRQGLKAVLGTPATDFIAGFEPSSGDIVINKPGSGAFVGTGLDELLRNLDIETVIVAGISFDGAVDSTVRNAADRGYSVVLAIDAIAMESTGVQASLEHRADGIVTTSSVEAIVAELGMLDGEVAREPWHGF